MGDLSSSAGGSSKALSLLVCTVRSDIPIFIVTLVGPLSSVTVHGPVHRGSSFPQLGLIAVHVVLWITACHLSHHMLVVVCQLL